LTFLDKSGLKVTARTSIFLIQSLEDFMSLPRNLLAVLMITAPLAAQDFRFGVQLHANLPSADLKDAADSKAGFGGGAHMTWDLGGGSVIRPRIDYVVYPENKNFPDYSISASANGKAKLDNLSAGADYLYFFEGKDTGFYITGGISWNRWKFDYDYTYRIGNQTLSGSSSRSANKVGGAAGVGFNLNRNFGVEARYTASKFENAGGGQVNAGAVQLAASYRF
jgi:hypothetical protein